MLLFLCQVKPQSLSALIKQCRILPCWCFQSEELLLTQSCPVCSSASSSNGSAPADGSDAQSGSETPVRTPASGPSSTPDSSPSAGSDRNSALAPGPGSAATRQPTVAPVVTPRAPAVNTGPLPLGLALILLSRADGDGHSLCLGTSVADLSNTLRKKNAICKEFTQLETDKSLRGLTKVISQS